MHETFDFENDLHLWQSFREGNQFAFETIYEKFIKSLYNYGYNLNRNHSLVEDSIQDLFIYLHEHRSTIGPTDNIKFYLFRSLRRILAKSASQKNILASEGYIFENALFSSENYVTNIVEEEAVNIKRKNILRYIESLPKRQKEAIFLLYVNGFSYQEVANTMQLEVKSVYNLINKAIKTLRENLQNFIFFLFFVFF